MPRWRRFDPDDPDDMRTTPPVNDLVWINEIYYKSDRIGYFDGVTFRTWFDSDDCRVTHWAPIRYPRLPKGQP